jgi:hypothetical protein
MRSVDGTMVYDTMQRVWHNATATDAVLVTSVVFHSKPSHTPFLIPLGKDGIQTFNQSCRGCHPSFGIVLILAKHGWYHLSP